MPGGAIRLPKLCWHQPTLRRKQGRDRRRVWGRLQEDKTASELCLQLGRQQADVLDRKALGEYRIQKPLLKKLVDTEVQLTRRRIKINSRLEDAQSAK